MPGALRDGLSRVAVRRFGRELQLSVDLIQQSFRLLSMALHVPLIGFLRGNNSFPSLLTQPLCGRKIWMSSGRDVSGGPLRRGGRSNQEQGAENHSENSSFDHGGYCTLRPEVPATRRITPAVTTRQGVARDAGQHQRTPRLTHSWRLRAGPDRHPATALCSRSHRCLLSAVHAHRNSQNNSRMACAGLVIPPAVLTWPQQELVASDFHPVSRRIDPYAPKTQMWPMQHVTRQPPGVIPQSRGQQPVHPGGIGFQPVRNPFGYRPRQAEAYPTTPETEGSPPGSNFPPAALLWRDPEMPTGEQPSPRLSFWTLHAAGPSLQLESTTTDSQTRPATGKRTRAATGS